MSRDEQNHVRVSSTARTFFVTLARTIDARTLSGTAHGHTMTFHEILDLFLAHHGYLPDPADNVGQARFTHLKQILAEQPTLIARGPVPAPVRPDARRRAEASSPDQARLIRALRRLVYTDRILDLQTAKKYCEIAAIPIESLSPEGPA